VDLIEIARTLCRELQGLSFSSPVRFVYNPLEYAWQPHARYLRLYGGAPKRILLLGMNPGPWGMAQTGVPFGDVATVRDWLGIRGPVTACHDQHPSRPVLGFECPRREVSGTRLWGWARDTFETPERFFADFFVGNYCPLAFFDEAGRNLTPDRLPIRQRRQLEERCDRSLRRVVEALGVEMVVGVGAFSAERARIALDGSRIVGRMLHPSPANPDANRGWAERATEQLRALGVDLPRSV
jgi:single-strand selective monofunctional uracil DNA glycosylase